MPYNQIEKVMASALREMAATGRLKGRETVITGVVPPTKGKGPRYLLEGEGDRAFLRMNSNGYLGLALHPDIIAAEEMAIRRFGTGPGAVRFISGTWGPHRELEHRLAAFHGRQAAIIFSSAYAAIMGTLPQLIDENTAVISDELNHNCIINAARLARPKETYIYPHLDMEALEEGLRNAARDCRRGIVVTDGIFSMRGDHASLREIMELAHRYDGFFAENVLVVADDSHGVGAFGATGRGTEEYTNCGSVDLLVGTLGKAFGVNGGYVVGSEIIVDFLRERSPFYVYSNPITPGEAAAAKAALDLVDSPPGQALLDQLRIMTERFAEGLAQLGLETISSAHPIVPLMTRDTKRTSEMVEHLRKERVLATGLNYPVVPLGDEEIRFQISADHTEADIDEALAAIKGFGRSHGG